MNESLKFYKGLSKDLINATIEPGAIYHCVDNGTTYIGVEYLDLETNSAKYDLNLFSTPVGQIDQNENFQIMGEIFNDYENNQALGLFSHAEGHATVAAGASSHAEGCGTIAEGEASHAEGDGVIARGVNAHAEGKSTAAESYAHAEGFETSAEGQSSHSEGEKTRAIGNCSHAEGLGVIAKGNIAHAEGQLTQAIGDYSHAEGEKTMSGCLGFYIDTINIIKDANDNTLGGEIYLSNSDEPVTPNRGPGTVDSSFGSPYIIPTGEGEETYVSVESDAYYHWPLAARITAIENNKITYEGAIEPAKFWELGEDNNGTPQQPFLFFIATQPKAGKIIVGSHTHAEGWNTFAAGNQAHSEGYYTQAIGRYAHAEGISTIAGYASHSEGRDTVALGIHSHAEGYNTKAIGYDAHSEGRGTTASTRAHAEGYNTVASGEMSHSEGNSTQATNNGAHAEGRASIASGKYSHAGGEESIAEGAGSRAIGYKTKALGNYSHAEGNGTEVTKEGTNAHAEGLNTKATQQRAHAEGNNTTASGYQAHAEGHTTVASGSASHAEGKETLASSYYAHAEGENTVAQHMGAHAEGLGTETSANYQHVSGKYNKPDSTALLVIGNGTSEESRSNILTVDSEAQHLYYNSMKSALGTVGTLTLGGNQIHLQAKNVDSNTVYSTEKTTSFEVTYEGLSLTSTGTITYVSDGETGSETTAESSLTPGSLKLKSENISATITPDSYNELTDKVETLVTGAELAAGKKYSTTGTGEIFNDYVNNIASNSYAHSEGCMTKATGYASHAEGNRLADNGTLIYKIEATGNGAHAEGVGTIASGFGAHAEGVSAKDYRVQATKNGAHAEGRGSQALANSAHAEGYRTIVSSDNGHAEGTSSVVEAGAEGAHAEGCKTIASIPFQHVQGKYNSTENQPVNGYAHIVGNGTSDTDRSNAHTLDWDGNAWFAGTNSTSHLITRNGYGTLDDMNKITSPTIGQIFYVLTE